MAEQAQEVTVTNTGQPQAVDIEPALSDESAHPAIPSGVTDVTVVLEPAVS